MSLLNPIMAGGMVEEETGAGEAQFANWVLPQQLGELRRKYVFGDHSRIKPARLDDLCGMPKVKEEVRRIIEFLRDYPKFAGMGVRTQAGVLLEGPAGTGKTLTARVIATETGAKLVQAAAFPVGGPRWTAEDVVALFSLAREYYASTGRVVLLYFDRLESFCNRKAANGVTTALLSELDGIAGKPDGVFVIATTTKPSQVDPEVLRPGRLGLRIRYFYPTPAGRLEILQYYVDRKPHGPIDLQALSRVLPGDTTPAAIEELVEGAYLKACQESGEGARLEERHLVELLLRTVIGPPERDWLSKEERYRACVHEAGHAIVGVRLGLDPKLVVVPGEGYERGVTLFDSERSLTERTVEAGMAVDFGGEMAEELVFGERGLWGARDVQHATETSIKLVSRWDRVSNYFELPEDYELYENRLLNPLSQEERSRIYAEALRVRERCYRRAREVLEGFGREGIERVARLIFEREYLLGEDLERAVREAERRA